MTSMDELAARPAALEERVEIQEGLRASQDRDLAALEQRTKAMLRSLQAISETVSDHTERLSRIEDRLQGIESTLGNHSGLLGEIIVKLDRLGGTRG